ncbi:hypothetical protein BLNAU_4917 [Blattamonas nauphoetae]|uniref:Secreted protein n=1 Tax=Blattamonas nauphoetae TaxID=2049346 RepID=A0ABQ9Y8P6_9EUKA|nr:hypothetical protein BLNAU_4917 [Blattamonas nauphoetae]
MSRYAHDLKGSFVLSELRVVGCASFFSLASCCGVSVPYVFGVASLSSTIAQDASIHNTQSPVSKSRTQTYYWPCSVVPEWNVTEESSQRSGWG